MQRGVKSKTTRLAVTRCVVEGAATLGSISETLGIDHGMASRYVSILSSLGWLDAQRAGDGRTKLIEATDEGRRALRLADLRLRPAQQGLR